CLAAGSSVDGGLFIAAQLEAVVQCGDGLIDVVLADQHGDADLGGRDELDVDVRVTQRLGEVGGHARVGLHAGTDEGDLADLVVVKDVLPVAGLLHALEQLHGAGAVLARAGEGDVGAVVGQLGDVLQHHVDVDLGVRDGAEDASGLARRVWDSDDGDLRLGAVVGNAREYCFFHWNILHRSGN